MKLADFRKLLLEKRLEIDEQEDFCEWLEVNNIAFFAVPNGGKRGKSAQVQAKREGIQSGVPDVVILLPGGRAIFVEMKRRKNGRVTPEQKKWIKLLRNLGFTAEVCKGSDEAIAFISKIIAG